MNYAPCMDTAPRAATTTFVETSFPNPADICFGQPNDAGYCRGNTTHQPVYSNLSTTHDDRYVTDPCGRAVIIIMTIVAVLIACKSHKSEPMNHFYMCDQFRQLFELFSNSR